MRHTRPKTPTRNYRMALLLWLLTIPVQAQWGRDFEPLWTYDEVAQVNPWEHGGTYVIPANKFTFARVRYRSLRRGYAWFTDYPDSDINFSTRLGELTTIEVNRDEQGRIIHAVVDLTDDHLFDFPFIYMVEVGNLDLNQVEANRLREYLLRGGFLMVDDFWEDYEWANWERQLAKVFPDEHAYPMLDVPHDHPIYKGVFLLDEVPQVPSIHAWMNYRSSSDRPGAIASCHGIFDHDGRLMVVVLHNTDLGDGWEKEGVDLEYFQRFSVRGAYPFGINIVVYAMTR